MPEYTKSFSVDSHDSNEPSEAKDEAPPRLERDGSTDEDEATRTSAARTSAARTGLTPLTTELSLSGFTRGRAASHGLFSPEDAPVPLRRSHRTSAPMRSLGFGSGCGEASAAQVTPVSGPTSSESRASSGFTWMSTTSDPSRSLGPVSPPRFRCSSAFSDDAVDVAFDLAEHEEEEEEEETVLQPMRDFARGTLRTRLHKRSQSVDSAVRDSRLERVPEAALVGDMPPPIPATSPPAAAYHRRTGQKRKTASMDGPVLQSCNSINSCTSSIDSTDWSTAFDDRVMLLPLVESCHPDLKVVSPATVVDLMNGRYSNTVSRFHIVDCRYTFEFDGGHIRGAVNISDPVQLLHTFIDNIDPALDGGKTVIIFHCEFSKNRGPKLLKFLRSRDRKIHEATYPELHYPEIYLLDRGYRHFFAEAPTYCTPQQYVEMLDPQFRQEHRLEAESVKASFRMLKRKRARRSRHRLTKSWSVGCRPDLSP